MLPSIPNDYAAYIIETGPFECCNYDEDADPGYVVLWAFDEIAEFNSDYEVETYAPGFVAFGSDGGGELLAFDETGTVFMLPKIGMAPDCAIRIADNFQQLITQLDF